MNLSTLDWIVVIFFLALAAFIGLGAGRAFRTPRDFFHCGRMQPVWSAALAITSTETLLALLGGLAGVWHGSWAVLMYASGSLLARPAVAVLFLGPWYRSEVLSIYEMLGNKYGSGTQRIAGLLQMATNILGFGVRLGAFVTALGLATDLPREAWLLLIMTVVLIIALYAGKGATWAGVACLATALLGVIIAVVLLATRRPLGTMVDQASEKFRWLVSDGRMDNPWSLPAALVGGFFLTLGAYGADQTFAHRTLTCLRAGRGRAALILSGLFSPVVFVAFLFLGTMLSQYFKDAPMQPVQGTPEQMLAAFYVSGAPQVVRGLMVAALLALGMATLIPAITATALTAAVDLRQVRIEAYDARLSGMGSFRFYGFLATAALAAVAWFSERGEILMSMGTWVFVYLYGPLAGLMLVGRLLNRSGTMGSAIAVLAGLLVVFSLDWVSAMDHAPLRLAWPYLLPAGMFTTVAVAALFPYRPRPVPPSETAARPNQEPARESTAIRKPKKS